MAAESARADSMLRLYQDALRIRRSSGALGEAPMTWQPSADGVLAFDRGTLLLSGSGASLLSKRFRVLSFSGHWPACQLSR